MSLTILLHSSKTMRITIPAPGTVLTEPALLPKVRQLATYVQSLSSAELARCMHLSPALAEKTRQTFAEWHGKSEGQSPAIDSFVGDIYSGLQAATLTAADRAYAQDHLRILSGLYGVLRPLDGVRPYRLEMGYRLPDASFTNLYDFWGQDIVRTLPAAGIIVNASAVEYTKTVTPFVNAERVVAPRFLTRNPKTGEPTQVTVHTKIARGAFARWLIVSRTADPADFRNFQELGYAYDAALSTPAEPTFVCDEFGGIGLSVRLQ